MPTLKEMLYQMFILGTDGDNYNALLQNGLGGIIFFTKDIQSKNQFCELIAEIKSHCNTPPFLSIDQEGGRVERTENIHNGKKYLSAKFAYQKGPVFLKQQTKNIATELNSYGLNLNFAPCIDVNTNPQNPIIGERAFSSNTDEVIEALQIVVEEYKNNGIIPCIKHFPGHGDADADSHLTLPEIRLTLDTMEKYHIKPFKIAIEKGIDLIMVAHLKCPAIDNSGLPTSLSAKAISYLRDKLGFQGLIVSDDMVMAGANVEDACEKGIRAGLNLIIYRNSNDKTIEVINNTYQKSLKDKELQQKIEFSYNKIMEIKNKYLK